MLIGSCMEYILRFVFTENGLHTSCVRNISYNRFSINVTPTILQFQTNVMQRSFSLINQDQLIWIERSDLSHNFATNRTGGSCNHYTFTFQVRSYLMDVHLNRFALQKVLNLYFLQLSFIQCLPTPFTQRGSSKQLHVIGKQSINHI